MIWDPYQKHTQTPVIASSLPVANTLTLLYTVPGTVDNKCTVLKICNQGDDPARFWVAFGSGDTAPTSAQYVEFNTEVCGNESLTLDLAEIWLPRNTGVWVKSDSGGVSFNLFGNEFVQGDRP